MTQLSFLGDTTNLSIEMEALKKTHENVRRGLFQRYDNMKKEMDEMRKELAEVKSQIHQNTDDILEDMGLLKKAQ